VRTDRPAPSPASLAGVAPAPAPAAAPATPTPAPGAPGGEADDAETITRTLAQLSDLRDQGAITAEEYEAKKRELLERL
jgi:hypothetical protein